MDIDKKEPLAVPPYTSYKTFKNFLDGLKPGIPSRIDRSVMPSYSGAVQAQLIQALRYFGLVSPNGHPTEKLPALVNSEGAERQRLLAEILRTGYAFLFGGDFDIAKGTSSHLAEQFVGRATGETVRKCIAFLLPALKDAGIVVSHHIKGAPKRNGGSRPRRQKSGANLADVDEPKPTPGSAPAQGQVMGWAELLLSKFPSFDPAWPDDVKAKWFASFEKLMASGKKDGA